MEQENPYASPSDLTANEQPAIVPVQESNLVVRAVRVSSIIGTFAGVGTATFAFFVEDLRWAIPAFCVTAGVFIAVGFGSALTMLFEDWLRKRIKNRAATK